MLLQKYKNIQNNIIKYEKHMKNTFKDNYEKYYEKYKKLNIVEQNILTNYDNYSFNINYYLVNNKIYNYDLIRNINEPQHKKIINLLDIYKNYINNLTNNINIIDNIINNIGINNKIFLYKNIYENNIYNEIFIKKIKETIKKIGNTILINSYESFLLKSNVLDGFKKKNSYIIEIDTNNFNYIYLKQNNILLPKNIEIEYIGSEKIHVNKNIVKNWDKYNKYGYHLYNDYIYKFKIINLHKINNETNTTINLPLSILNNIYYMKEMHKPVWNSNE